MPDLQTSLDNAGGITKAMLSALNQIEQYVAASQIGPDGKPSGTAVYMHMPMGYTIDPKMYSNPWGPASGSSGSQFNQDGTFVQPTAPASGSGATATDGKGPPGSVFPPPKTFDPQLAQSIQNAMYTSKLVDHMLEVTQNGVAVAWPERNVSIEYFTILAGIQPVQTGEPEKSVRDAVEAAKNLLYLRDDKGNAVGYTQLYAQYRRNRTAWTDAIGAQAAAYAKAMSDPVAGQAWPIEAATYANKVQQALDDFNSMGRREVENALNTIATVGQNAVAALCALAHQLYDAHNIQLEGGISSGVPWSYMDPVSWWDHTDNSFGVQTITATSEDRVAGGAAGSSSFANNWWNSQSSSTSASAGIDFGFVDASANYSHDDASNAFAQHSGGSSWSHHADKSSKVKVTLQYFIARIERPWLLGDLFNIEGWYLVGQKKNSISDGTISGQVGDHTKLMPMIPKAFLVIRNLSIEADDWGTAGDAFEAAQQNASGSGQSSSNSYGGSIGYFGLGGSVQHSDQQAGGAFGSDASSNSGWSFHREGRGGTLSIMGSQSAGWIGEIQPAAPRMDAPAQTDASGKKSDTATTATGTSTPAPADATATAGAHS
jgi:hypothetical protein